MPRGFHGKIIKLGPAEALNGMEKSLCTLRWFVEHHFGKKESCFTSLRDPFKNRLMIEIFQEKRRKEKGQHLEEGGGVSNPRPLDHEERAPRLCYNHCHKFKTEQSC